MSSGANKSLGRANRLPGYDRLLADVVALLESGRRASVRAVNALLTATYWGIGHRIVEWEQAGQDRAPYGEALIQRLAVDLTRRFGRGFGYVNLTQMRRFYVTWPARGNLQTLSEESNVEVRPENLQTPSEESARPPAPPSGALSARFPLTWSHYVRLLAVPNEQARRFYETEALRGGWSVRQLDRQIGSLFYERIALSKNKAAMLAKGRKPDPRDLLTPEEEIKDPYVLEFVGLKDEYSESQLEESLIHHLEAFLLELGDDFAFVGRQRRLRIGNEWYRVDLLFFHRKLKCLMVIDLKTGSFSHADAGQMHLYLNYAQQHWMRDGGNPPVGLILCAQKDASVVRYALDNLPNKILAAEYRLNLPHEAVLAGEIARTRKMLETRAASHAKRIGP